MQYFRTVWHEQASSVKIIPGKEATIVKLSTLYFRSSERKETKATDSEYITVLELMHTCLFSAFSLLSSQVRLHYLGAADALPTLVNQVCWEKFSSTEAKQHEAAGDYVRKISQPSSHGGFLEHRSHCFPQQDCPACSSLHKCMA